MIEIKDLTKYYGKNLGCSNINLNIDTGKVFGLIGPNGAGKSTIIKCMMNLIKQNSGEILFDNGKLNLKDVGYLPGELHLYDDLTIKAILKYNDSFYQEDTLDKAYQLAERLKIDLNKKISDLSLGNLKKVGIVLALAHSPKYIIMDEATSGLDPLMQNEFFDILKEEKNKGNTIFFSTHILSEVKKICDEVGIIKEGNIIKVDSIEDFMTSNSKKITIISNDIDKFKVNNVIERSDNKIIFMYSEDLNVLVKDLSMIKIDQLLIEDASIDEVFMHFYK